jgi:hypothetical protein
MASIRIPCPESETNETGHGDSLGYSVGGALSHASRCATMNAIMAARNVNIPLTVAGRRGVETEDEFFAAAAAKYASLQSQPAQPVQAAETIEVDGKVYRAI